VKHPAPPRELIEKVKKLFQEKEQKRLDFIDRYGHIKPPFRPELYREYQRKYGGDRTPAEFAYMREYEAYHRGK